MQPLYTADNTSSAYKLNWSVSLFANAALPPEDSWLEQLRLAAEPDGVRILEFQCGRPNVGQFLVSSRPQQSPSQIVRTLKGRLRHLVRAVGPIVFRRNYHVSSVGDANCRVLDAYVARQSSRHPMADPRVQRQLQAMQFHDPGIDLQAAVTGNYGRFLYNLQLVVENADGWHEVRENVWSDSRTILQRAAAKKNWRLSRIGLLSNHSHLLLGASVTESPESVALSVMNNLAYVQQMKPVLKYSYYVGTFGPYDLNAVRRTLPSNALK